MIFEYLVVSIILLAGMVYAVKTRKLDLKAAMVGGLIAALLFAGSGWVGLSIMIAFFLIGSAATGWRMSFKVERGLEDGNKGKRKAAQVVANGRVAALLSVLAFTFPEKSNLFFIAIGACFSSATADTVSSELGNVYGRKFYNVLSMQTGNRGSDGVVSIEGTLFGFAGSVVIAVIYLLTSKDLPGSLIVILAGNLGNLSNSVLRATLQQKGYLNNNWVNFLNTIISATAAIVLQSLFL